ncbi:hypothetical protein Y1Q_0014925 [Alligator mississippiensis]|uniref:Uncharacterized protein n=1 Tax=Alligator mississippiensis TaxID=8496 RepID=A0A151N963_ALLMI|nr:hypothetical protein Y1Q_0014925 [Alligator mississippiensis]
MWLCHQAAVEPWLDQIRLRSNFQSLANLAAAVAAAIQRDLILSERINLASSRLQRIQKQLFLLNRNKQTPATSVTGYSNCTRGKNNRPFDLDLRTKCKSIMLKGSHWTKQKMAPGSTLCSVLCMC